MAKFKLPHLNDIIIDDHIVSDLDLSNVYCEILSPTNIFAHKTIHFWYKGFTSNVKRIHETQYLLQQNIPKITHDCSNVHAVWENVKNSC